MKISLPPLCGPKIGLRPKVEYFKKKYGENPRSDIMGIDGCALFVLIYIVVPGQH